LDTVLVCDTEPIAIEGLRSLVESSGWLRVVASETSLADGMDAARELRPSIFLVDKAFGLNAVMDFLRIAREGERAAATVVWGNCLPEAEALRLLQAGASGVVHKTASLDSVLTCLRTVAAGGTWMESSVQEESDRPVRTGRSPLTARERQVMELVERGMKNKEIGNSLGIRTGTVKIHLKHIFEKTGIRGRYGLALSGLKEKGLLAATEFEPV
jgi:DNA-binding NarL/FixJ family response regulator